MVIRASGIRKQLASGMLAMLMVLLCALFLAGTAGHSGINSSQQWQQTEQAQALVSAVTPRASSFSHPRQLDRTEPLPITFPWQAQPLAANHYLAPQPLPPPWFQVTRWPPNRVAGWRESNLLYRSRLTFEV
ncbi:hypothetical protein [Ferrimonas futtsuensis]|uniref:hypothetical protein n=1 Tax=Ferrimonas futtsuensis TaxID=364764 RepID=UPI00040AE411|nr:hypothetical protein [Ferrimonas futtsuensis]